MREYRIVRGRLPRRANFDEVQGPGILPIPTWCNSRKEYGRPQRAPKHSNVIVPLEERHAGACDDSCTDDGGRMCAFCHRMADIAAENETIEMGY
jgi:hypothetical protein